MASGACKPLWLKFLYLPYKPTLFMIGRDFQASWSHNMNILVSISHILITVNCSSNFAIYCSKVKYFDWFLIVLDKQKLKNFS